MSEQRSSVLERGNAEVVDEGVVEPEPSNIAPGAMDSDALPPIRIGFETRSSDAPQTVPREPSCRDGAHESPEAPSGSLAELSVTEPNGGASAEEPPAIGGLLPEVSSDGVEDPSAPSLSSDLTSVQGAQRWTDLEGAQALQMVGEQEQEAPTSEDTAQEILDSQAPETGWDDDTVPATSESETAGDAAEEEAEALEADPARLLDSQAPETGWDDDTVPATSESEALGDAAEEEAEALEADPARLLDSQAPETGWDDDTVPATSESEALGDAAAEEAEALEVTKHASSTLAAARAERVDDARQGALRPRTRNSEQPRRRPSIERALPQPDPEFRLQEAYLKWNRVLADQCLLDRPRLHRTVYLSVTPMILAGAWEASEGDLLSPALAQREFSHAVASVYRSVVMKARERIWTLASRGLDGTPNSIAFLACSVLAAYMMRSDETVGPNAYYQRFSDLLGCEMVAGHPEGFDVEDFSSLWLSLASWVAETGQLLALPTDETAVRRHIAYPLCHVPLREVDIEKLPDFFSWAGLEPGSRPDLNYLGTALVRWSASSQGRISQAGRQALSDDRRDAVEAQVALELGAWDGSLVDRQGTRIATVQIMMDVIRHQPVLSYLPRRPAAFPEVFDDGVHVFESAEHGWYEREVIPSADGESLKGGFSWSCSTAEGLYTLRRPPATSFALRAGDFTGFISQRGLPIGMESAAACVVSLEAEATAYLASVVGTTCRPVESAGIPDGWLLFRGVVPRRVATPPPALDSWSVDAQVSIALRGGLRLGRRSSWMTGAVPEVVIGAPEGVSVSIDGQPASVTSGRLESTAPLDVGSHIIEVGYERRRFEVVEPVCNVELGCDLVPSDERSFTVPLPAGSWTVIGKPGELRSVRSDYPGTLLTCSFQPVWAISSPSRGKPGVVALTSNLPLPIDLSTCREDNATRSWVALVYSTGVRHPPIGWTESSDPEVDLRRAWRIYCRASKDLKRRWRRRL
jgi:hypothetical protein